MRAEPRHTFVAYRSRSRAGHIEDLSTAGGGFGSSSRLNETVEHHAVPVRGTPEIVLHPLDADEHLIKVPLVTGPRTTAAQAVGKALAKLLAPASNSLIGDNDATIGQHEFNISKAETEPVVQPDSMTDDLGRKPMAIVRVGLARHPGRLAGLQPGRCCPEYADDIRRIRCWRSRHRQ